MSVEASIICVRFIKEIVSRLICRVVECTQVRFVRRVQVFCSAISFESRIVVISGCIAAASDTARRVPILRQRASVAVNALGVRGCEVAD